MRTICAVQALFAHSASLSSLVKALHHPLALDVSYGRVAVISCGLQHLDADLQVGQLLTDGQPALGRGLGGGILAPQPPGLFQAGVGKLGAFFSGLLQHGGLADAVNDRFHRAPPNQTNSFGGKSAFSPIFFQRCRQ